MGDRDSTLDPSPAGSLPEAPRRGTIPLFREGDWIGRYQIVRLVGRGGMGMVYEAMQEHPYRRVALKVMDPSLASPGAIKRFTTEAQLLGRLDHEGIARIYEADTHREPHADADPVPFFAMEFISGARPITDFAAARALDLPAKLELFTRVCDAIDHGHREGVLHRDLKPENVVVDGAGRVKVIDFGIARVTEPELAATRITEVGQLVGTLQYMSPEQFDGYSDRLDVRSDVYSLGVLLYELVCGRLPYDVTGKTVIQAAHVVRESQPSLPSRCDVRLKGDVETIILKAIHKDPGRRYQTAAAMSADLRRFLKNEPIEARQDSAIYVARKRAEAWAWRKPELAILLLTILVVSAVNTLLTPVFFTSAPGEQWFMSRMLAGPVPAPLKGPWEHVRVVTFDEQTRFDELGAEIGLAGISREPSTPRLTADVSWRAVHGAFMQRLARTHPRSVLWDQTFSITSEHDRAFLAGVDALNGLTPRVEVVSNWRTWLELSDEGGTLQRVPYLNSAFGARIFSGATLLDTGQVLLEGPDGEERFEGPIVWTFDLALRHEGSAVLPSAALLAYAAGEAPGTIPITEFQGASHDLTVRFEARDQAALGVPVGGGARTVKTSLIETMVEAQADPDAGLRGGDKLAVFVTHMPGDDVLAAATVRYEDVMHAAPAQLAEWFNDRIVLIGQLQDNDRHLYPDGRVIPGTQALAATVESLSRGVCIRAMSKWERFGLAVVFAVVGALAAAALCRSWRRLALVVAALSGLTIAASLWLYRQHAVMFSPIAPLAAMVAAALLAGGVLLYLRRCYAGVGARLRF